LSLRHARRPTRDFDDRHRRVRGAFQPGKPVFHSALSFGTGLVASERLTVRETKCDFIDAIAGRNQGQKR
jgi:hypothetical protein